MPKYICIGVPYFIGQRIDARTEVEAVQKSGFAAEIGAEWVTVQPDFAAQTDPIIAVNHALAQVIAAYPQHTPVIFASDCMSALGVMKGLEQKAPGLLWLDAHGDFNTHETTPSGFLGGMPLAMLVGRGDMTYMQGLGLAPIKEGDVMIADARDLDPEEGEMLAASQVRHVQDLADLLTVPLPGKPLYIHFDTDVVNLEEMPGMSYPAAGGPSLQTAQHALEAVTTRGQVAALLFGLWNDALEPTGKSLASTLQLARAFVAAQA